MDFKDLTIIIPTFNEEKNIGVLLTTIKKLLVNPSIIVSDDGSKDKTQEIVCEKSTKGVVLLDRRKKPVHGLTVSVMDAIMKCKTPYFVVIDADFQHPPEKIKEIVEKLRDKKERYKGEKETFIRGKDIVVGNRAKISGEWPIHRLIISEVAYFLGRMRLWRKKFPKYDLVSGFFGGRTGIVKKIIEKNHQKFELKGYKVLFDILKYLPQDAKVDKVDYEFGIRHAGESKLSKKVMFYYFRSLFR